MQPFDYYRPKDIQEAFQLLALPDKIVYPFGGGTDFIPMVRDGLWKADVVVDIKGIEGIRDIRETGEGLFIGAAVTMSEVAKSQLVKSHAPLLAQGAAVVGNEQVRNRATIGGNLCTASPCADTPPPLCALDALVILKSKDGERRVPVKEFFTFVRKTVIQKGELVYGVIVPKHPVGTVGVYEKLSRRKGCDLSLVSVAALAKPENGKYSWRIALGAVAPTVIRATEAEAFLAEGHSPELIQKAAVAAAMQSKPISDVRASEAYRKSMVRNITKRAIEKVIAALGLGG